MQLSLPKLWQVWYRFRQGKYPSAEIDAFAYSLEPNLGALHRDLVTGRYQHGPYRTVTIVEHKRRDLAVAGIRDRVVHRLLYEFLVHTFDRTFSYDVWSCRRDKGLLGAIERTQDLVQRVRTGWVWRADITKFFDHVDHAVLKGCIRRRVKDRELLVLLDTVIDSFVVPSLSLSLSI